MSDTGRRFPAKLFGYGQEPDPRFPLANQRTFLAWISTSLRVIALLAVTLFAAQR